MQINGSGGSFEQRIYEKLDVQTAWQLGLLTAAALGVKVDRQDEAGHLLDGTVTTREKTLFLATPVTRLFTFSVKPLAEGCLVILDIRKERLEVYNFKPQNKENEAFFRLFEEKLKALTESVACPGCGAQISRHAKFCPECGFQLGK